ncbi:PIR Superfamily Protein [Plasmodium ovale curtisi]|uniref:PIR Superfamily Protein n=1 Tax=Plasmodium ovale curtisi TaxID=864141 RepID=A0A1A8WD74_PLAOA|nr:PIR Superfamily Protein [Plasmodium ovale curtisi]
MPLEIQTILHKLDYYKNDGELENNNSCSDFTNSHLITQGNEQKICRAAILFFKDLNEQKYKIGDTIHEDITYRDNGCKYLFYWLYTYELNNNNKTFENTLNIYKDLYRRYNQSHGELEKLKKHIDEINVHTSAKLVKLTNLYNTLDNYFSTYEKNTVKEACTSYPLETYISYVEECRKEYDNDFCNELKNFRKKYNSFIKNVIKCEEKYLLSPVESIDVVGITIIPFSLISVTSLILPILYKFTAFGPWIRRLIKKNDKIMEYINEETHHSLNTYAIEHENSNIRSYNIPYNSS